MFIKRPASSNDAVMVTHGTIVTLHLDKSEYSKATAEVLLKLYKLKFANNQHQNDSHATVILNNVLKQLNRQNSAIV